VGLKQAMQWSALAAVGMLSLCCRATAAVKSDVWGAAHGKPVKLFVLSDTAVRVRLTEYGARIVSIDAPDRSGQRTDIVLGYNNLAQYVDDPKDFFGAVVGRYANRIAKGTFSLDGTTYHIPLNSNGNALHGGPAGFSSKVWRGRVLGNHSVEFTLISPDGDMGFPGALTVRVRYSLVRNELRIDYGATTTKATVVNLTNHTYFNLAGESSGDVLGQEIRINADQITPIDASLIPTGEMRSVADTPFDLRQLAPIGSRIGDNDEQLRRAGGYDHNFVVNGRAGNLREAAFALDPKSGRTLTVLTTQPGVQFYSGNFLNGSHAGYSGALYRQHDGFCLETQHFPDSPNRAEFPSTVLRPGERLHSVTVFVFGVAPAH